MNAIGRTTWVIGDGYIPETSNGPEPELVSHEAICVLNTGDDPAHLRLHIYYTDRDPVGPYQVEVGARRTRHVRFNDLIDPEALPLGTEYAVLVQSDVPVVVQHTRLDSRQAANAIFSTIAYPAS